jgi:TetR/AcrR family transcriptional regulator, cholesterol catabolism regulator
VVEIVSDSAFKTDGPRLQRIIESAIHVFAERGYSAATLEEVAGNVDILKGSLYYYISGKSDLLFYLLTRVNEDVLEIIEGVEVGQPSPEEALQRFTYEHSTYNAQNAVRVSIYYRSWFQLEGERKAVFRRQREEIQEWFTAQISALKATGRVADEIDAETSAFYYFGSSNWIHAWYGPDHPWNPEQVGADCSRSWLRSIGLATA